MSKIVATHLVDRGVIAVSGKDQRAFLQGIVTNDMNKVSDEHASYGAFLTPQGKYLFDFFMVMQGDTLLIETERARIPDFVKRLTMYKLRARIDLSDVSEQYDIHAVFGDGASNLFGLSPERGATSKTDAGIAFVDPRLVDAGVRLISASGSPLPGDLTTADTHTYDHHRLTLGLPDGSRDLIVEKSTLMDNGFDELGGIDWQKGCYMGQEVTARTKHRGLVKKRLVPVTISGSAPEPGTAVMAGERIVGEMRSANGDIGLALIKLDAMESGDTLSANGNPIELRKPAWAAF